MRDALAGTGFEAVGGTLLWRRVMAGALDGEQRAVGWYSDDANLQAAISEVLAARAEALGDAYRRLGFEWNPGRPLPLLTRPAFESLPRKVALSADGVPAHG